MSSLGIGGVLEDIGGVYLNAVKVALNRQEIRVVEVESSAEVYRSRVRPWLEDATDIAYWTQRPRAGGVYTTYLTAIDQAGDPLGHARSRLEGLGERAAIKGEKALPISRGSVKLIESAVRKKLAARWHECSSVKGYIECVLPTPPVSKHMYSFHRAVRLALAYIDYVGTPALVIKPHARVEGPPLRNLIEQYGEGVLQKLYNREVVARRKSEGRLREAVLLAVKPSGGELVAEVMFYDGSKEEVGAGDVRLPGSVLRYKEVLVDILGEQAYRELEQVHRELAFSLGSKESSLQSAKSFADEVLRIAAQLKEDRVFPLRLGDAVVDIEERLLEVG